MSDPNNRTRQDFSKYDSMSTEELDELIRSDAFSPDAPDGEFNTDEILYILEVAVNRKYTPEEQEAMTRKSWNSFKARYMMESEGKPLYGPDGEAGTEEAAPRPAKPRPRVAWKRRLLVISAVILVLVGSLFTAQAMGFHWVEAVAQWTDDVFHFRSTSAQENVPMTDALTEYGYSAAYAPTYIPEGYVPGTVSVYHQDSFQGFSQAFTSQEGDSFKLHIIQYTAPSAIDYGLIEKDASPTEVYRSGQTDVYIFSNLDGNYAACISGLTAVTILGELDTEEIKNILDSMEI